MKKPLLLALLLTPLFLSSQEGTCRKCEQIREENKGKVNPYPYYDEYLKEHPENKESNIKEREKDVRDQKDLKEREA